LEIFADEGVVQVAGIARLDEDQPRGDDREVDERPGREAQTPERPRPPPRQRQATGHEERHHERHRSLADRPVPAAVKNSIPGRILRRSDSIASKAASAATVMQRSGIMSKMTMRPNTM